MDFSGFWNIRFAHDAFSFELTLFMSLGRYDLFKSGNFADLVFEA